MGINQYQDDSLPSLDYPALDCQGLAEALALSTQGFPNKEVIAHHDFAPQAATRETVHTSLQHIVNAAQPSDTVLFYFSGHGVLDPETQQAVLCLSDTQKDNLFNTGLGIQELLQLLGSCAAHQQQVWLDACHSGGMTLMGARGEIDTEENDTALLDPSKKLEEVLRKRAAKSKGFYALLSCDQGQRSWEFPELGHGLFTYYLMRGLQGEAADADGVIEADRLYRYVYRQTLQYIEKANQQLRLVNQKKRVQGEPTLHMEYPLQTPKRIVEGVGELILGLKPDSVALNCPQQPAVAEQLSPEQHTQLKEILKQLVGSVAPILLQNVSSKAPHPKGLLEQLRLLLPPQQQVEFDAKTKSLLEEPDELSQGIAKHSSRWKTQVVNENFVRQCERTLADLIGPTATFIVQKVWLSHPQVSLEEFVKITTAKIPDSKTANEFYRRLIP